MATVLPPDLSVRSARLVEDGFHPRYDAKGKEYTYLMRPCAFADPFWQNRAWQIYRPFVDGALEKMQEAASAFCGKQDFAAFMSKGSKITDTVRTVKSATVEREGELFVFRVVADGFLYNMVRIMTGTLADVAFGAMKPEAVPSIIAEARRASAGETAPPEGLYLTRVFYDEKDFLKTE